MQLFHPRIIAKFVEDSEAIPAAHHTILSNWSANLAKGIYDTETQSDGEFIQQILIGVLGYRGSSNGASWNLGKNQPIGSGNVDVALGHFTSENAPGLLAPLELKGAKTRNLDAIMPGRNKSPAQQAWEYATDISGCRWVLVSNYRTIRLYAFDRGRQFFEEFDLQAPLSKASYWKMVTILCAENLLGQETYKLLQASDSVEKEITGEFYRKFNGIRTSLTRAIISHNSLGAEKAVEVAQTILDRILFIAFAEDRGLLPSATIKNAYESKNNFVPSPVWSNFLGLFEAIDKGNEQLNIPGYNGGLFANNATISSLKIPDSVCESFRAIGAYDFSTDISVNILGHVFEQSIADIDALKAAARSGEDQIENTGKRHEDGIFYTNSRITSMMVSESLSLWLEKRRNECGIYALPELTEIDYESIRIIQSGKAKGRVTFNKKVNDHIEAWQRFSDALKKIRIVDPACGSGAFLTAAFDALLIEGRNVNSILQDLHGGQEQLFRWDRHILQHNLFGVDINSESIEITKLSLWLKTASKNEKLTYIDNQIVCGNSLVADPEIAKSKAFNWVEKFGPGTDQGLFDIVLCNPPYVDSEAMTRLQPVEREWITRNYRSASGNWDLYIPFVELGFQLLNENGVAAFITPDKWLAKDFGVSAREMLHNHIFKLVEAGRGVFDDANVDAAITLFSRDTQESMEAGSMEDFVAGNLATFKASDMAPRSELGQLFSKKIHQLTLLARRNSGRLSDIVETENACATSDTYTLKPLIRNSDSKHSYNIATDYKVANTGTISPYASLWGIKPMTYLKDKYLFPTVQKSEFSSTLGKTYNRRAASPKVIVKGLTLLDGMVDVTAEFIPGKSTLVLCHEDEMTVYALAGIINSSSTSFYIKEKNASASYNGGVNFTPAMLNELPIPDGIEMGFVSNLAKQATAAAKEILLIDQRMLSLIRAKSTQDQLKGTLVNYWNMTSPTFLDALKAHGLKPSLSEQGEWIDFLDRCKEERGVLRKLLQLRKNEIDTYLDGLFGT